MPPASPPLHNVYTALLEHFGPQGWWPGRTRLETCVGAILTQHTAWTNVEKALRNVRRERALSVARLRDVPRDTLAEWVRPAGTARVKAERVKAFVTMVVEEHGGSLTRLFRLETGALRASLLAVRGIGPETADCILVYAAGRARFVVDAYTRRILERHGWLEEGASYDEVARLFHAGLPGDVGLFNEYHALLVATGKSYCRPRPECDACPLRHWLPKGVLA